VDSLDHHDDHFFPGCRDIAWDLAGSCVEFGLGQAEQTYLIDSYSRESRDRSIASRLRPFRVAYLAFRSGYARMASETLGGTADGRRFSALADQYASSLRAELANG
jgi:hypothetical protein